MIVDNDFAAETLYENKPLFIFGIDNICFGVPVEDKFHSEETPVVQFGEGDPPTICYTSLTKMILTFAECCETDAYYISSDGYI